jgi:hypothetical protein
MEKLFTRGKLEDAEEREGFKKIYVLRLENDV